MSDSLKFLLQWLLLLAIVGAIMQTAMYFALRKVDPPECVEWIRAFRESCYREHPDHHERCEEDVPKQRSHCEAKMAGRY